MTAISPAGIAPVMSPHSDASPPPAPKGTKLLVAVHGIGDQTAYETIQAVALRVSAHSGQPVAMPLGRFYLNRRGAPVPDVPMAMPQLMTKDDSGDLAGIGLAEAYWAPIPRDVTSKKFILEETKRWARSIAGRVAYSGHRKNWDERKVEQLVVVLDEMVDTIRILERITSLAEKAGVFKFNLGKLLVDFVGDVQIVADFQVFRQRILDTFDDTIKRSLDMVENHEGDVYIVAHSEGTVVTFVALLEALCNPEKYPWIHRVRGLMTIGSPIEIHHLLWPSLWRDAGLRPSEKLGDLRIDWHNYMDFGDPIAYDLMETSNWLKNQGFEKHFTPVRHAFSRYPLPGKAHVDYWADREVFGHFLEKVVGLEARKQDWGERLADVGKKTTDAMIKTQGAIRSKRWVSIVAFVLPYLIVAGLMIAGAYIMERSVSDAFGGQLSLTRVVSDVAGIGALMFGITAASRLPRISDSRMWTGAGWGVLVVAIVIFGFVASVDTQIDMGRSTMGVFGMDADACVWPEIWGGVSVGCAHGAGIGAATIGVAIVSILVALLSGIWSTLFPRRGHYMLPALGLLAALAIVGSIWQAASTNESVGLGGVLLGGVAFFYLWWLSALIFDLVFIWRRYTRDSRLCHHLAKATSPSS